jgi:hypothetical protein
MTANAMNLGGEIPGIAVGAEAKVIETRVLKERTKPYPPMAISIALPV